MSRYKPGFTIVEITVTIVIIGLLVSIGIFGYSRIQAESRDSQRTARLGILAEALEKYYAKNGEYPSCSAMTQSADTVASTVLPGLDKTALIAPKAPTGTTNSITCTAISGASGPDVFAYVGDGSGTCSTGAACLKYTLQYREENTSGTIKSLDSRHQTQLATTGTPTLTATTASSTSIALSWTSISGATSYQLQRATNTGFSTGLNTSSQSGTSVNATGLTNGTTYYFRVAAITSSGQGSWSNTASATATSPVSVPTSTPATSIAIGTDAVGTASTVTCTTGTAQYQLRQRSTATTTDGSWSDWSAWSTTKTLTVSPALQGWKYDFQAQARCLSGSTASAATAISNTASDSMPIAAPAAPSYLSPASFQSGVSVNVLYAAYCPYGTTVYNGYFNSRAWTGANFGPYAFGTLDYWNNLSGSNKTVEYWGYYQCQTPYRTSPLSPGSYNVITVTP